jgi:hypothetical protein
VDQGPLPNSTFIASKQPESRLVAPTTATILLKRKAATRKNQPTPKKAPGKKPTPAGKKGPAGKNGLVEKKGGTGKKTTQI